MDIEICKYIEEKYLLSKKKVLICGCSGSQSEIPRYSFTRAKETVLSLHQSDSPCRKEKSDICVQAEKDKAALAPNLIVASSR